MKLTIDNQKYQIEEGDTILDVAQREGVYIPTLCSHNNLAPFGACRMCLVEVKDKGIMPSCTTPAEDDMIIYTNTETLNQLKQKILELVLSEHPSACILCQERELCFDFHGEPTKAGRSTGCRFCPARDECKLYEIAKHLGLEEIPFSLEYRDLPLKRDEPFIERDYNLCILCGKCVRVCDEVRGVNAIDFTNRGYETVIGTAFDEPLVNSGCIFCGACVDVCPTGSLSEKRTKWGGTADQTMLTTCLLCPVGCRINVETKRNNVINVSPSEEGFNNGQLCVKGRFVIPTLVNHPDRIKYPMIKADGRLKSVPWDEAISRVAKILKKYKSEEIGFVVSPWLTNESAYMLQKLARGVIGTDNIAVASNMAVPAMSVLKETLGYCGPKGSVEDIKKADVVLIVGTDLNLSAPVLLVSVYEAKKKGAQVIVVDKSSKKLPLYTDMHVSPDDYLEFLLEVFNNLSARSVKPKGEHDISNKEKKRAEKIVNTVRGKKLSIVFGSNLFDDKGSKNLAVLSNISKLEEIDSAALIPAWDGSNLQGILEVGAVRGYLPGQIPITNKKNRKMFKKRWGKELPNDRGVNPLDENNEIKVLYLTQSVPKVPDSVEVLILQDVFESDMVEQADVVLPASAFTEEQGTVTSLERRVQNVRQCATSPGMAIEDWTIFSKLASALNHKKLEYDNSEEIKEEIFTSLPYMSMGLISTPGKQDEIFDVEDIADYDKKVEYVSGETTYRGISIGSKVSDFEDIVSEWGY